jgi:hypothetical protein
MVSPNVTAKAEGLGSNRMGGLMVPPRPMLHIPESQQAREVRQANLSAQQSRAWQKILRRLFMQCIMLTLLGVPLYGYAWHLTDPRQTRLVVASALFVSYAFPLLRLLVFHVRAAARGDY